MENMYGVERLHASYGWLLFAQGLSFLFLFPLSNWLDSLSPISSILFTASCMFLSALFMLSTIKPFYKARDERLKRKPR